MTRKELLSELKLSTYVALDFETTGLDPKVDRIIEVAAIRFVNGEPKKGSLLWLIQRHIFLHSSQKLQAYQMIWY